MENKFTNFLSCFYANTPQNTGGGNSHSSTVVTPVWKGSRPTVSRQSTDSQSQDHRNHTPISKALKYAAMILMVLTLGVGNAWGANGDVLFSQDFNDATAVAYDAPTTTTPKDRTYNSSSTLSGLVGSEANLFTHLSTSIKKGDIAINSSKGGNSVDATGFFQVYSNTENNGFWSITRTADFAATAPTALKVSMDIWFKNYSSGSDNQVQFAIGDGFDGGKTNASESSTNVHSGFALYGNSTAKLMAYDNKNTVLYATGITQEAWLSIVWIINNTGDALEYNNPTGSGKTELPNDKFDIWVKTQAGAASTYTKIVSEASATTATKDLQEIYIGNKLAKKHQFRLDNVVVTDLTPAAASCESAPTVSSLSKGATTATTQVVNCAGISSLGSEGCTISSYGFVYGTSANPTISDTKVQVGTTYTTTGTAFATTTLTGLTPSTNYYVRAYATNGAGTAYSSGDSFTTPASIGNVTYIAGSADASNDAIKALRDANYVVTVRTKAASPDYTGVDLVVLDESLSWAKSDEGGSVIAADVPILNLKAFFYTLSNRWNWGTPVNPSPKSELATLSTEYSNVSSHPIFDGVTISEGAVDMIGTSTEGGNNLQGVTTSTLVSGKEGYTLATSASGTTCIHELTPAQRGVTNSKYLLIALSNNVKDNYSADAKKMIVNAAAYLIDNSEQWAPAAPSCAATAEAGADKSTTVGEGVAMAATAATSGYTGAWSIKAGSPSSDADQLGTTSSNTMTFTPNNTGTYTLVWTVTDDNDNTCYATSEATVTVTAPTHAITYNTESLKGSDVSAYPTEYTEGVGIASFTALADVTNFHFNGWSPASIGTDATEDVEMTATWVAAYNVTFSAGDGGGTVPTTFQKWQGATFALPEQGSMTAPSLKEFDGWKANGTGDKLAAGYVYTMGNAPVEFVAQWKDVPTHTISLDANGGSIVSYEGWTKVGDVYSKTVEEGTEVSLLAFTKADVQLMFFRDGSANEYSSSVTLNANLSLKAVWGEEKEVTIYSWESPDGTAVEVGGTAKFYNGDTDNSAATSGNRVNYVNKPINGDNTTQYYTLSLNKDVDYSTEHVRIFLDEELKAGDEIEITAYYTKSENKSVAPKIANGSDVEICTANNVPNLYNGGEPVAQTKTLNASAEGATTLKLTRSATSTTVFITKLVITGTRVIEVMDPAQAPTISAHPAGASYTWKDAVSALTVTAAVTDGGTLHYQWYKAGETDTKVGTDAASYTPEESGTYYVVVTNKKTGYSDKSTTSNNAVVTIGTRPSYTVTYYDGASSLGTESVLEDAYPAEYAAKQAKAVYGISGLYEFNGWYNNSDLAEGHKIANIAAFGITANTNIYGKWTRIEAEDVNLVEYAATIAGDASTTEEFNAFKTWFSGQGYVYSNLNALDNKSGNNGAYLGLKTKSDAAYIAFNVPANKRVTVKLGYMAAAAEMYINGVKNESQALTGGSTSSGDNYADWYYDVDAASTFKLQMKNTGTCVVKAITIGEIPALSDDATLNDLKVDGTTVDGFAANKLDYYVELAYGTADAPTIAGTANDANAQPLVITQAASTSGNATIVVTAQDNTTTKTYTVHFSVAPKFGVELIKATHTGEHTANKAGYWSNDVTIDKTTQGGGKLGSDDHYFGMTLGTNKFMNGDLLCIYLKISETPSNWLQVFKDKGTNIIVDQKSDVKRGANYFTLSGLPEGGIDALYLYRNDSKMNPYVDYIAVYREMDPFFESFTVADEAATIDETVSPKTINVIVPAVTDITSLTPTYKAWANGGATVSPTTAQDFSAGAIDYTVTSAYSETTTYKVTVTKAAAIDHINISGTTTVMEGNTTTLSAAVYDTNEALAANQNVTWSIKSGDESLAEVDASGVVTGKAAGTAHIIATSEADGDISAEVEVTINAFVGTKRVYWFAYAADATENGVTNNSTVFGSAPTGSNSGARTVTLEEGWVVNTTKYAGAPGSTGTFVVPAEYTATFYAAAKASGSSGRYIQLKQGDVVKYTSDEFAGSDPQVVKIEGVVAGTYTIAYVGGMSNFYLYAAELSRYAISSVTLESGFTLRTENSRTPAMTIVHAKAAIALQAWSIVSSTAPGTTINASTGEITAGTVPGTITVQVEVTDAMSNVVTSNICTVEIVEEFERIDVTGSMTWNWNELSMSAVNVSADRGLALANYIEGEKWQMLNGTNGDYAYRNEASGCYEAMNGSSSLSFHTTVPGLVKITGKRRSNDAVVKINGEMTVGTVTSSTQTFAAVGVQAGEVSITPDANGMRITKLEFIAAEDLDPADADYTRSLTSRNIGTICLPKAGFMIGAAVFEIANMDYQDDKPYKIYFVEVPNGTMVAGKPYVFLPDENSSLLGVFYTASETVDPNHYNGLYGYYSNDPEERYQVPMNAGNFIISGNKYWYVDDNRTYVPQNRAYIKLEEVPGYGGFTVPTSAPGRRISLDAGSQAPQVTTDLENLNVGDQPVKMMIDGNIYILRGEKMYDVTGKLVK